MPLSRLDSFDQFTIGGNALQMLGVQIFRVLTPPLSAVGFRSGRLFERPVFFVLIVLGVAVRRRDLVLAN